MKELFLGTHSGSSSRFLSSLYHAVAIIKMLLWSVAVQLALRRSAQGFKSRNPFNVLTGQAGDRSIYPMESQTLTQLCPCPGPQDVARVARCQRALAGVHGPALPL